MSPCPRHPASVALAAALALTLPAPLLTGQCQEQDLEWQPLPGPALAAGAAVAMDGGRALVGAPQTAGPFSAGAGTCSVFDWTGASWEEDVFFRQEIDFLNLTVPSIQNLGTSVSIDGVWVALGAPSIDGVAPSSVALLRQGSGGSWLHWATWTSPDPEFGRSVSIHAVDAFDFVLAVGQPHGGASDHGQVLIYDSATSPVPVATLDASSHGTLANADDGFGAAVALDANPSGGLSLIVGVPGNDTFATDGGATIVFDSPGPDGAAPWTESLGLALGAAGANYGGAVAMDDGRALVGAPFDGSSATDGGGWEFLRRTGAGWVKDQWFPGSLAGAEAGAAVALEGDDAVIGMPGVGGGAGAARLMRHDGSSWVTISQWQSDAATPGESFGSAVAVAPGWALVGAPLADSIFPGTGLAHAYKTVNGTIASIGVGTPGFFGITPQLSAAGQLCGDDPLQLLLSGAVPSSTAHLVVGVSNLSAPFKGGTLVPSPDIVLSGLPTGFAGSLLIDLTWPPGLPPVPLYFQYWVVDAAGPQGFSATKGLSLTSAP